MKRSVLFALFAVFLCVAVAPAHALMFGDLDWSTYDNGAVSRTFASGVTGLDYELTISAINGNLTWNPDDGGLGVGDDEITGADQGIEIVFSEAIWIDSFVLVDLFQEGSYLEQGEFFYLNSGLGGNGVFEADPSQTVGTLGWLDVAINDWVSAITFFAANPGSQHDFALAGYTSVPEPATALLLGLGMIGLAGLGRRKFKKQ